MTARVGPILFFGAFAGAAVACAAGPSNGVAWPGEMTLSAGDRNVILRLAHDAGLRSPVEVAYSVGTWLDGPALTVRERDREDPSGWTSRRQLRVWRADWRARSSGGSRAWVAAPSTEMRRQKALVDDAGSYALSMVGEIDPAVAERLIAAVRGRAPLVDRHGAILGRGQRDAIASCARYDLSWSPERDLFTVVACADERTGTGYAVELRTQGILIRWLATRRLMV